MSIEVPVIILILAIPTYFLSKRVLKKLKFGNDKDRKYIALFPTLILSPILYFGIILLWMFSISYYPSNEFNKQEWEANHEERYKMSEDIIDSKMLIGKTKEEITRLLGQDFWAINENHIAYKLGTLPRLFNIDPDALNIYFENEKVIKVEQR